MWIRLVETASHPFDSAQRKRESRIWFALLVQRGFSLNLLGCHHQQCHFIYVDESVSAVHTFASVCFLLRRVCWAAAKIWTSQRRHHVGETSSPRKEIYVFQATKIQARNDPRRSNYTQSKELNFSLFSFIENALLEPVCTMGTLTQQRQRSLLGYHAN